jgi:hypothetical protein
MRFADGSRRVALFQNHLKLDERVKVLNDNLTDGRDSNSRQLLLTSREAAQSLRISERHLWTLTARGDIQCIRMNASKRYPISELERYIARQLLEQNRPTANSSVELSNTHINNNVETRKQN